MGMLIADIYYSSFIYMYVSRMLRYITCYIRYSISGMDPLSIYKCSLNAGTGYRSTGYRVELDIKR